MTQSKLAEITGLTMGYVSKLERNEAEPSASTITRIAKALGTSTDALLFDDAARNPAEDLKLLFELASALPDSKKEVVKEFILTVVQRHQAQTLLKDE
jgi:transcriptional regulator with XRE-family HTH domain